MITLKKHGDIKEIALNDGKVNVLNEHSLGKLQQALRDSQDAKAIVLTGVGKCFSAGLDLKRLPTLNKPDLLAVLELFSEVIVQLLNYPRPVIAAINGHAIAGGAVLSLCCDQSIGIKREVKIGLSEVAVGMPLPSLVVELARHRLAPTKLTQALLFGQLYSWEQALEVGYLHEAVEPEHLLDRALDLAQQVSTLPGPAYQQTKASLVGNLPQKLEAEAIGSFLTDQAQQHMARFKS